MSGILGGRDLRVLLTGTLDRKGAEKPYPSMLCFARTLWMM